MREFAPIEGDPVWLGEQMSDLGMAVESIDRVGEGLDGIVVAKVLDLRAHPRADRIQLVDVDLGDGEALQICCGAFNMSVGDLVPLATIGTKMPGGATIERKKLRGEWSNGMLCSGREIGLGDDHEGILILDRDLELGSALTDALGLAPDVLYDLEINPNRPDAMSVAGVARDLAARLGVPFQQLDPVVSEAEVGRRAAVTIVDPDLCGRFYARVLDGVSIGPSPAWIANRLRALGMRPINRVVDASNYVMLELGQPNHTYDLDRLATTASGQAELRVRFARSGETMETLDGIERTLSDADGVIADANDVAVGLAGVMGGASTEISAATTAVLLELAWWDPMTIARTSKRLNLRSEASARFERGTDPEIVEVAARRFAELLAPEGARLSSSVVDEHGALPAPPRLRVRTARVNGLLGTELEPAQIRDLLEPIGFEVTPVGDDQDVAVPSFRPDTTIEIDVVEEVARHYGYAKIPRTVPPSVRAGYLTDRQTDRRRIRDVMVGLGLDEAMPLAFLAPEDVARAGIDQPSITLTNPLAAEESVLRPSLRPGLLKSVLYNQSHRNPDVGLFEIGQAFRPPLADERLPDEHEILAAVRPGQDATAAVDAWTVLAETLRIDGVRLEQGPLDGLHPGRSARLVVDDGRADGDGELGRLGEIDPAVLEALGIVGRVAWLEVDLDRLLARPHGTQAYVPVSRYPSSDVDLAFVVDDDVDAADVRATIATAGAPLLVALELFDVFRNEALGSDRRSLAFRLRLQADDHTLTDEEVGRARAAVVSAVESAHAATLRG